MRTRIALPNISPASDRRTATVCDHPYARVLARGQQLVRTRDPAKNIPNPGKPVPLAMFANVADSYLWAWTAVGAAIELLFQILPVALGLKSTIDAGLARVFFSWTLHAIVYFWLASRRRCGR
jgi:hypothetical protein